MRAGVPNPGWALWNIAGSCECSCGRSHFICSKDLLTACGKKELVTKCRVQYSKVSLYQRDRKIRRGNSKPNQGFSWQKSAKVQKEHTNRLCFGSERVKHHIPSSDSLVFKTRLSLLHLPYGFCRRYLLVLWCDSDDLAAKIVANHLPGSCDLLQTRKRAPKQSWDTPAPRRWSHVHLCTDTKRAD